MIREIKFENFKSLRNATLPLSETLTVIVGANNSGKSNALTALKLLRGVAAGSEVGSMVGVLGGPGRLVSRGQSSCTLTVDATEEEVESRYRLGFGQREFEDLVFAGGAVERTEWVLDRGVREVKRKPAPLTIGVRNTSALSAIARSGKGGSYVQRLHEALTHINVLDLSVASIREEARLDSSPFLEPDGRNLPSVLDHLSNTEPDVMDALLKEVGPPVTDIKRILTPPGKVPGTKVIGIQEQDGMVYQASDMSDGLLLFIAMSAAVQLRSGQPSIIAIEEPERGIHPRRIRDVVDQFRRVAAKGTQVVITTHSPILLDEFRDSPESVVLFDRDENGTRITRLSEHPEWKDELVRGQPLGDIWYSGLLGGSPR